MIRVNHIKNNKILQYIVLSAALLGGFLLLNNSTWIGDSQSHTLIESASSIFAFVVGVLALVHFNSKKNNTILFISVAYIGAGFLDLFHAAVTSTFVDFLLPSAAPSLIPWSWNASRTFLAVYLWLSYIFWRREVKLGEAGRVGERTIFGLAGILTIVSFVFFAFVALPPAYFDSLYFHRPEEFVAAGFFLAALVGYLRKGFWKTDTLNHWLILSLIVGFIGQAVFMSTSGQLFDAAFVSAHLLKIVSYLFVVIGLLESMFSIFRQAEERAGNILSINDKLADEILERERVENSLRESEERLKAILYSVNDAIITITEDQNIILFNTGAEKIFLYKPEDIIGQPIETLIPERFRVNHKSHIHEFGETGVTERGMQPITELVGLKSNGEEFPIDADISRITLGGQLLFTVILRDVTRQRNMEEKIRKSNAELESYATIVSHDLRAPLRALTNYSRFLQEDASEKLDSDDLENIEGIIENAARMNMLISDLLEYSSIGRSNNDYQPIDLRSLIANVVSGLDIEKEAEIQLPEDYPPMNGYIVQIDQLFSNLLSNAIKYKRNDVGLEIAISWVDNPNDWQFCIEDNGIGIDDKYRHKIFELFHRLHTQEEYAGTGVGLSVVKKVVEEHGGKVWVKSIPEKGSTFYFTISKNIKKEII